MSRFAIIMPAAGKSSRFGDPKRKKVFAELAGRAVWLRSAELFVNRSDVGRIVVLIDPEDREMFERRYSANAAFFGIRVVDGGKERVDSVANGLAALGADCDCDFVAIHDAARPCLTPDRIDAVFQAAIKHGAAALGTRLADTIKRSDDHQRIVETVLRDQLWAIQTPQAFRRDWLERAFAERHRIAGPITDDLRLVEALGETCVIVEGSRWNLKITNRDDLELAAAILHAMPKPKAEGPAHPFADDPAPWRDGPKPKLEDLF